VKKRTRKGVQMAGLSERLKLGVWVQYGFSDTKSPTKHSWFFGEIVKVCGSGFEKGELFLNARVKFTDGEETQQTFFESKEGKEIETGWKIITEGEARRDRSLPFAVDRVRKRNEAAVAGPSKRSKSVEENEVKIQKYFAEYKEKYASLEKRVVVLEKKDMEKESEIKVLKNRVRWLENETEKGNIAEKDVLLRDSLERYVLKHELNFVVLSDEDKKKVYPRMLEVGTKGRLKSGPEVWNVGRACGNMYKWEDGAPVCLGAELYKEMDGALVSAEDGVWYLHTGAHYNSVGYHVSLSRFQRDKNAKLAHELCQHHGICKDCMKGIRREFVSKHSYCYVCSQAARLTKATSAPERQVPICRDCHQKCGERDYLSFLLRIVGVLFPRQDFVVKTEQVAGYYPDTVVQFNGYKNGKPFTVLIEMDTDQHSSEDDDAEVGRIVEIVRKKMRTPEQRVFVIRFDPSGKYKRIVERDNEGIATSARRLVMLRQWIIWYIATAEMDDCVPPFLMLYLWYDEGCRKVAKAKERFGEDVVCEAWSYPDRGVWEYYGVSPLESMEVEKWDIPGSVIGAVFPKYDTEKNGFRRCQVPECLVG
jgi:hypothetical protein